MQRRTRSFFASTFLPIAACLVLASACASADNVPDDGGEVEPGAGGSEGGEEGGAAGATGGKAGATSKGGASGKGGTAGKGGEAGSSTEQGGKGGASGKGGTAGAAGKGGTAGSSAGAAGKGGTAGSSAGKGGGAGTAGKGGASGSSAGASGKGGASGSASGAGGGGASAGTGGGGSSAGGSSAGTSGGGAAGAPGGSGGAAGQAAAGSSGAAGAPNPAVCGNGTIEPGEECDDGNTKNGDWCNKQCVVTCYYGKKHPTNGSCYEYYLGSTYTWNGGNDFCSKQTPGYGHLATFEAWDPVTKVTPEEDWVLANVVNDTESFWIGVTDVGVEDTFTRADGSALAYTRWWEGEPNDSNGEDCVEETRKSGTWGWNDNKCSAYRYILCEYEPPGKK